MTIYSPVKTNWTEREGVGEQKKKKKKKKERKVNHCKLKLLHNVLSQKEKKKSFILPAIGFNPLLDNSFNCTQRF